MRLNGWQRLWVLVSVIYISGVLFIGWISRVSIENYNEVHSFLWDAVLMPESFHAPQAQQEQLVANPHENNLLVFQKYKKSRNDHILNIFLVSLMPSIILYILGVGIAWIKKGFRKNN